MTTPATATATTPGGTSPTATPTVQALSIGNTSMPDGNVGTDYSAFITANGGQTATGSFTIDTPGKYTFECSMPGHASAGMRGTITVQ